MSSFALRTLTSEDKIFFPLMNLVIVLFTFEDMFSPLSPSFYLKVPLPSLGSARNPNPPPPPPPMLTGSLLLSYSLLTRFFWRWLRAWHRLCCGGLTPLFPLPRQFENGQTRESFEKYCKTIGLGTKNTSVDRHELGPKKKYRSRFILNKYCCNSASTVENVALKLVDWIEWNQA